MTEIATCVNKLTAGQVQTLLGLGVSQSFDADFDLLSGMSRDERAAAICTLLDDLNYSLVTASRGPLSLERLTGLSGSETSALIGKSVLDVLAQSNISRGVLEAIVEYGRFLADPRCPVSTRLCGMVISALASASLASSYGVASSAADVGMFISMLDVLVAQETISVAFRTVARDARAVFCGSQQLT